MLSNEEGGELLLSGMPKPKTYWDAFDSWVFPGVQGGPLMHVIAAKAVAFGEALKPEFRDYARKVVDNAKTLAEEMKSRGYKVVSGGTDTHLVLLDLSPMNKTGKAAEKALEAADITVNKNMVPYDPQKPLITSGVRIGSPAVTSRGMGTTEMKKIAELIDKVIQNLDSEEVIIGVKAQVHELTRGFPLYPNALRYNV